MAAALTQWDWELMFSKLIFSRAFVLLAHDRVVAWSLER